MQYLLAIYSDESGWADMTPEDGARMMEAYGAFTQEVKEAGAFVAGDALQRTSTATTVRVRDGEPLLTDGPFAETREQLGGYYLLECGDLDEAIRWAGKIPGASYGCVEVRPIMDYEASGAGASAGEAAARG